MAVFTSFFTFLFFGSYVEISGKLVRLFHSIWCYDLIG